MDPNFHLVDDAWLPIVDYGMVGLREAFARTDLRAPSGTPIQKIAIMKLLLAVAQAATTPEDDPAWRALGPEGMAEACLSYLETWKDAFRLYGDRPFLQMPAVRNARAVPYGALLPEVASGNNTVLTQGQQTPVLTDALRALTLLVNMSCCFSGKKVDKTVTLSPGVAKSASAKAGPALCSFGLLHTFLTGKTLRESVWLNLLTRRDITANRNWTEGLGTPPWEAMPTGEACPRAEKLRHSLMGRLVPLARFYLLEEDEVHSVEGIVHPDYLQGSIDPSVTADFSASRPRVLWADPGKRPWRSLTALLGFLHRGEGKSPWLCPTLAWAIPRLRSARDVVPRFGLWCGGIRLSSNAGEQYLTGMDDMVESDILLESAWMDDGGWFDALDARMAALDGMAKALYGAARGYYTEAKADNADPFAASATLLFWQQAERLSEDLINACGLIPEDPRAADEVMRKMAGAIYEAYNAACPQGTARQLQIWAKHRPAWAHGCPTRTSLPLPHTPRKVSNE